MPVTLNKITDDALFSEIGRRQRVPETARLGAKQESLPRSTVGIISDESALEGFTTWELLDEAVSRAKILYGEDNRADVYQLVSEPLISLASSVCALVHSSDLYLVNGVYQLKSIPFRQKYSLCACERFGEQPVGAFCSGFLVAPDIVATAGHCAQAGSDTSMTSVVFDFIMQDAGKPVTEFPPESVYSIKEVVNSVYMRSSEDWALIRLDRKVENRTPLRLRRSLVPLRSGVFVMGHPVGLPLKYADGASVTEYENDACFKANLDTYGGNSGSPIFEENSLDVVGVLVRGDRDFISVVDPVSGVRCFRSNVIHPTGGMGEGCTHAFLLAEELDRTED